MILKNYSSRNVVAAIFGFFLCCISASSDPIFSKGFDYKQFVDSMINKRKEPAEALSRQEILNRYALLSSVPYLEGQVKSGISLSSLKVTRRENRLAEAAAAFQKQRLELAEKAPSRIGKVIRVDAHRNHQLDRIAGVVMHKGLTVDFLDSDWKTKFAYVNKKNELKFSFRKPSAMKCFIQFTELATLRLRLYLKLYAYYLTQCVDMNVPYHIIFANTIDGLMAEIQPGRLTLLGLQTSLVDKRFDTLTSFLEQLQMTGIKIIALKFDGVAVPLHLKGLVLPESAADGAVFTSLGLKRYNTAMIGLMRDVELIAAEAGRYGMKFMVLSSYDGKERINDTTWMETYKNEKENRRYSRNRVYYQKAFSEPVNRSDLFQSDFSFLTPSVKHQLEQNAIKGVELIKQVFRSRNIELDDDQIIIYSKKKPGNELHLKHITETHKVSNDRVLVIDDNENNCLNAVKNGFWALAVATNTNGEGIGFGLSNIKPLSIQHSNTDRETDGQRNRQTKK